MVIDFEEDDIQEGGFDANGPMPRVRIFKCKVSQALGAEDRLYQHRKELQYGAKHPTNSLLRVSTFVARQACRGVNRDGHYLFTVTVTYAIPTGELEESPLDLPAKITLAAEQYDGFTCFDHEGVPIRNSAGDLVYMPREMSRWVFDVSKNLPGIPSWLLDFNNSINNGLVTVKGQSCKKETLMCKNVKALDEETVRVNGRPVTFTPFTFQLHFRREGWKEKHPNVGFNELVEIEVPSVDWEKGKVREKDGKVVMVKQKTKRRIKVGFPEDYPTEPQPLDRKGRLIQNPGPKDILEIEADVYPLLNFGQLPLR